MSATPGDRHHPAMNDAHACADRPTMLLIRTARATSTAPTRHGRLQGPDGEPTGAIHGFVATLRRIAKDIPSEHAVCVFDAKV